MNYSFLVQIFSKQAFEFRSLIRNNRFDLAATKLFYMQLKVFKTDKNVFWTLADNIVSTNITSGVVDKLYVSKSAINTFPIL